MPKCKKPPGDGGAPNGVLRLEAVPIRWIAAAASDAGDDAPRRFTMVAYTGGEALIDFGRVVFDLSGIRAAAEKLPILLNHDFDRVVGHADRIEIGPRRITLRGVVSGGGAAADEVLAAARRGFPWMASVGVYPERVERVEEGATAKANGRGFRGPLYIVRAGVLGEASCVPLGGDTNTSMSVAASAARTKENGMNNTQTTTIDDGTPEAAASPKQPITAAAPAASPAASAPAHAGDPPVDALIARLREAEAREIARMEAISRLCGQRHAELRARAVAEGWDAQRTELEVLRAERPAVPAIHVLGAQPITARVVEAALALQAGLNEKRLVAACGAEPVERARPLRRSGLRWLIERYAAAAGRPIHEAPGTLEWVRAAFSTADIAGIVGNVANKALQEAFESAAAVAPRVARAVSHANFHQHTVYSLAVGGELQEVAPTGELQHLTLDEESRTRKVSTRGAVLSITREDLVNDDLGAFADAARRLARKAVLAREKALFEAINATGAGSSFFTSARNNYFDGASSALGIDSVGTAVQKFRDQTGPDGENTLIEPRILLVPSALEQKAKQTVASTALIAVGAGTSRAIEGGANPWANAFDIAVSPMLGNASLGGSSTAWYLIADPADVPAFEIAYLNGVEAPTIEFWGVDADPNVLGVTWRVYYDFGVALAEYRAGVKSKGAA